MNCAISDRLAEIDRRWELHRHRDPAKGGHGRCLAFVVDERYAVLPGHPRNLQFRLGASFGHNPFTPDMACGFVPPPVRPGEYVFGIHLVATQNGKMTIFDEWYSAEEAPGDVNDEDAVEHARRFLAAIPDEQYLLDVKECPDDDVTLQRSAVVPLESLEIVDGDGL